MDDSKKLAELLNLAEAMGIEVRSVPATGASSGQSAGALVRLKGREILFLDSLAPVAKQIALVVRALQGRREIEECFIKPVVRDLLNSLLAAADQSTVPPVPHTDHWSTGNMN